MILMPFSTSVHYKVAFDILNMGNPSFTGIKKDIKEWLKAHDATGDSRGELDDYWFDYGTEGEQIQVGDAHFRVAKNSGQKTGSYPQNWAVEFIHKDSKEPSRLWSTEIALTEKSESEIVRLACVLKYATIEGWVGEIPPAPSFSVPRFVRKIILKYDCRKEGTRIQSGITESYIGAESLARRILNTDRVLPLVVSVSDENGKDSVDLERISKIVKGNANVYYLQSEDVCKFNGAIPECLRLSPGMVRIYFRYNISRFAQRRHRFFTKRKVEEVGAEALLEQIGVALSRNAKSFRAKEIIGIRDVNNARRLFRLQKLKQEKNTEYINLLEEDNDELSSEKHKLKDEICEVRDEKENLEKEVYSLKGKVYNLKKKKDSADGLNIGVLAEIPDSIESCLEVVAELFPKKIKIHPHALDSANDFSYNTNSTCIRAAWKMLYSAATILHDLIFQRNGCNIEKEFKDRTLIELSMKEGRQTKRDKNLMKTRCCTFGGKEIKCHAHMKGSRKEKDLRLYFGVIPETKKILIHHCGAHMDNYSTKKMN